MWEGMGINGTRIKAAGGMVKESKWWMEERKG
jgi:hypothetical protein